MTKTTSGPPATDWGKLIEHWLHDPPDKALAIQGHEARAVTYLTAALGYEPGKARASEETKTGDIDASIADRLPLPEPGPRYERAVSPQAGTLAWVHPLSGGADDLDVPELSPEVVKGEIHSLVSNLDDMRLRYLALWRLLPERLASRHPAFSRLPADTRVPDHTIWQHLDATAGLSLAREGNTRPAFLSFALWPVQPFIQAARSLRDLWAGSALLSWLTFQGMTPILEQLGPTSLVYPALRGAPLADLWLRAQGLEHLVGVPPKSKLRSPSIPHRFLAIVPAGPNAEWARSLAQNCRERCLAAWRELASDALGHFRRAVAAAEKQWEEQWSDNWESQADSYFGVSVACVPWEACDEKLLARLWGKSEFAEAFPTVARIRSLMDVIPQADRPPFGAQGAGRWQTLLELSARVMEEQRRIRHVPAYVPKSDAKGYFAPKCTLLGTYEQIGPADLGEQSSYWQGVSAALMDRGIRLDEHERFCAVALTKRLAPAGLLGKNLVLRPEDLRFRDTATLGAADWLDQYGLDSQDFKEWNGQWLHLPRRSFAKEQVPEDVAQAIVAARQRAGRENAPPTYYAIIKMDGDKMGEWLRGQQAPPLQEVYHPVIRDYFQQFDKARPILEEKRPVSPALHAAISQALATFAVEIAPSIVENHNGALVYCGGDDLLALVPCRRAAACARALQQAFCSELWGSDGRAPLAVMGPRATISAGIAIVHYKNDLRDSLAHADRAEKSAKQGGRNAVAVAAVRRSGESRTTLLAWDQLEELNRWVDVFTRKASDRWAYHLMAEAASLIYLPDGALQAELRRRIGRADPATKEAIARAFGATDKDAAGESVAQQFQSFKQGWMRFAAAETADELSGGAPSHPFVAYLSLVQTASFIARGREEQ